MMVDADLEDGASRPREAALILTASSPSASKQAA